MFTLEYCNHLGKSIIDFYFNRNNNKKILKIKGPLSKLSLEEQEIAVNIAIRSNDYEHEDITMSEEELDNLVSKLETVANLNRARIKDIDYEELKDEILGRPIDERIKSELIRQVDELIDCEIKPIYYNGGSTLGKRRK